MHQRYLLLSLAQWRKGSVTSVFNLKQVFPPHTSHRVIAALASALCEASRSAHPFSAAAGLTFEHFEHFEGLLKNPTSSITTRYASNTWLYATSSVCGHCRLRFACSSRFFSFSLQLIVGQSTITDMIQEIQKQIIFCCTASITESAASPCRKWFTHKQWTSVWMHSITEKKCEIKPTYLLAPARHLILHHTGCLLLSEHTLGSQV